MYKVRLHEMCQKRKWATPEYAVSRDGPDHNARFRASVVVNGVSFEAPDLSKSSKEAQNKAAQVAVDHLAAVAPPSKPSFSTPPPFPPKSAPQPLGADNQILYKNQIQNYAQRKRINLPKYDVVREGYAHDPRFKASVTVDGQTFYSHQFFNTVKEAETDAAKVAFLSLPENLQDEPSFYKNFLQELAQKEGLLLPKYNTVSDGASHMPIFSSTVDVGGETFAGDMAKTKKQAEMNAAKVAWCEIKKRLDAKSVTVGLPLSAPIEEHLELPSLGSQSKAVKNLEPSKSIPVQVSCVNIKKHDRESPDNDKEDEIASNTVAILTTHQVHHGAPSVEETKVEGCTEVASNTVAMPTTHQVHHAAPSVVETKVEGDTEVATKSEVDAKNHSSTIPITTIIQDHLSTQSSMENLANGIGVTKRMAELAIKTENTDEDTTLQEGPLTNSTPSDCSESCHLEIVNMFPDLSIGTISSSLHGDRVKVYPRKPNMILPEGATMLPFSDEHWVAASLSFSTYEDAKKEGIENKSSTANIAPIQPKDQRKHSNEIMVDDNGHTDKPEESLRTLGVEIIEDNLFEDNSSTYSAQSTGDDYSTTVVHPESPMDGNTSSLLCDRVRVYPSKPNMVLPDGASLLPFSDEKWTAVGLDFPNHDDGISV